MNHSKYSENEHLLGTKPAQYSSTQSTSSSTSDPEQRDPNETSEVTDLAPKKSLAWLGYVFCILSGLCFIACNVCIKFASTGFPVSSWQMLFVRCAVQKVSMVPIFFWTKVNIFGPQADVKTKLKMGLQAALSGCLLLCYFEGIRRLPLGDFGAIAFSSPAFTMVLSIFLLKDHCGLYRIMIGTILTVGVVLISRPPALFPTDDLPAIHTENVTITTTTPSAQLEQKPSVDILGIVFALTGSALSAWVTIIARQLSHIHFSVQVFWFSLGGEIISLLGMFLIDTSPLFTTWSVTTWLLAVGQAVLGLVGTVLILKALKWISPTKNKVIRSFQVVGSYIIQVEAFGTIPHLSDYAGALLIVTAVLGIAMEDKMMKTVQPRCRYI